MVRSATARAAAALVMTLLLTRLHVAVAVVMFTAPLPKGAVTTGVTMVRVNCVRVRRGAGEKAEAEVRVAARGGTVALKVGGRPCHSRRRRLATARRGQRQSSSKKRGGTQARSTTTTTHAASRVVVVVRVSETVATELSLRVVACGAAQLGQGVRDVHLRREEWRPVKGGRQWVAIRFFSIIAADTRHRRRSEGALRTTRGADVRSGVGRGPAVVLGRRHRRAIKRVWQLL